MAHWVTLLRGLTAVALGVALLFQPDMARPLLGNFMGGFWFASGLISIRWGLASKHARAITIIIGVLGALAGLSMLGRRFVPEWVDANVLMMALGAVILLTGVLHVSGHMPVHHGPVKWTKSGFVLGLFEIVLGLVIIVSQTLGPILNLIALIWAFLGGFVLIHDAWQIRVEMKPASVTNKENEGEGYENS